MTIDSLADQLVQIAGDYRRQDDVIFDRTRVLRWVDQFQPAIQERLLAGVCHALAQTYISNAATVAYIDRALVARNLVGADPGSFWRSTYILDIQQRGSSQQELVALLKSRAAAKFGQGAIFGSHLCSRVVYLDDGLFSGSRARADLARWIRGTSHKSIEIHCIFMAVHSFGQYSLETGLEKAARESGKTLTYKIWRSVTVENKKANRNASATLWPRETPQDPSVQAYLAKNLPYPLVPRRVETGRLPSVFVSEESRHLMEQELVVVGCRIINACANPHDVLRPLGFYNFGLGFGTMIVTFRNCPNNAPQAFWWGGEGQFGGLAWFPLFPRKAN